jgi:hypothetical protein
MFRRMPDQGARSNYLRLSATDVSTPTQVTLVHALNIQAGCAEVPVCFKQQPVCQAGGTYPFEMDSQGSCQVPHICHLESHLEAGAPLRYITAEAQTTMSADGHQQSNNLTLKLST